MTEAALSQPLYRAELRWAYASALELTRNG
jgi:hypothetical protein